MKFISLSLISIIFLFISSCDVQEVNLSETSLIGTWQLKQVLADPGNGSGTYQNVPENQNFRITFNTDGTASGNTTNFGFHMIASYEVLNDEQIRISFQSQSSQPTTTFTYHLTGNTLEILGPCIEACGLKFVRK